MKLNRPPGDVPELMRPGGLTNRPGRGLSLLGICLLAAVIGGPASLADAASPNTHVQRPQLAAFVAGSTPQTISFDQPPDTQVGEPVTLSASAAPGLEVSFTSNTPAVCTVLGPTVTTTTAGVCVITASQEGDATYAAAPEVARSFQVTAGQAGQTITFTPPADTTAGALVSLSASAAPDPALVVSFTSDTPQVCTVSESTVQTVAAGACVITAAQGGSATYAAAPEVARSFQVTTGQAAQTITFTRPADTMAGVPVSLSASAAPGLEVSFASSTPAVCTVSESTVQTVTSGTCTITAAQGGSADYAAATQVTQSFQVTTGEEPQTVSLTPPPEVVRAGVPVGEPVALSATATSGLPVSYTSAPPQVCMVSGSTVLTVGRGTCTITASQGGSETYQPASAGCGEIPEVASADKQGCFGVYTGGEPQAINFSQPPDTQVGVPVTLLATATSGLPVSFTSDSTRVCTVVGSTVLTAATGTCMITASQGGSKIYGPAHQVQRRFAVKLGQTITFDPPPDTPVHTQVPLTATASSKLQVSFTSGTQGVCTVSGTVTSGFTATTVTPGTCTVTATQSGNGIWAPAPDVTQSFTVTKKGQQITFDPLPSTPAHTRVPLTAKAIPSGLQVSFTSSTERVCTVSGTVTSGFTATTVTPGTCTITATQDGDDTWAAATPVRQSFTVTPPERKPQTITFTRPPDRPVDTRVPLHDPRATPSELPVTFTSNTTDVCTVADSTATAVKAGTCTITATQDGNEIWAPAPPVKRSFTVTKKGQTITFDPPKDAQVHARVPLTAKANPSGLPVSFTSSTQRVCTVSGSTATTVKPGTCTINASQSGNADYAAAPDVQRSFQVNQAGKKSQTIAFAQPSPAAVGATVALSASATSGLPVSFASSTPAMCTVSGSTATTVAPGACMITASQGGDADYGAAPDVAQSFQVNAAGKKPQTITFAPLPGTKAGEPVTLSASASSRLPVSFASSTPAVCTVSGSTATPVAAGTCTVTASQSGDASYAPAPDVAQSFQVNAAGRTVDPARHKSQTITFTPPPAAVVGEPVTLSASASSGLQVSFASNTPAVCAVSGSAVTTMAAGACAITASQGGNANYAAAGAVTRSFQVDLAGRPVNPAGHKSQTITFEPPAQPKAGDPVTLSASSSSGLPVSFTSDTPPVCTVTGSSVITMAAGACTITASQTGSTDYAAAPPETRSFQVNPASPTGTGPLVFLLAAAVLAAAGLTAGVRRLRLRSHRPPVHAPTVRAVPEPGPPGQVDVHDTGPTGTRTVRVESNPGASIMTIEEARP